jgi:hypothetical protein
VAALGLAENSSIVLVASMLISPLMVTIILNAMFYHVKEFRLWNFVFMEIMKHDHNSHNSDDYGINIKTAFNTGYKTTAYSEKMYVF